MVIQSPHSLNCEALLQTCLQVRPFIVEDGEIHRVANVTCPSQPITPQDTFSPLPALEPQPDSERFCYQL